MHRVDGVERVSQFSDRRTRAERAVAVEVCNRGDTIRADVDAIKGVRASSPLHKHRRRRRPGVLDVDEFAIVLANYEVHVAVAVEVCKRGGALQTDVDAVEWVRASDPLREGR